MKIKGKKIILSAMLISSILANKFYNTYAENKVEDNQGKQIEFSENLKTESKIAIIGNKDDFPSTIHYEVENSFKDNTKFYLTSKDNIEPNILDEIKNNKIDVVYLIGDEEDISKTVEDKLKSITRVVRVSKDSNVLDDIIENRFISAGANPVTFMDMVNAGKKSEAYKKEIEENKKREEAERKAREEAERKKKEEAERKAKEEAEKKAKAEAERKAKEEAEKKAKAEAQKKQEQAKQAQQNVQTKPQQTQQAAQKPAPTYSPYTITMNGQTWNIIDGFQGEIDQRYQNTWVNITGNYGDHYAVYNNGNSGMWLAAHRDIAESIERTNSIVYTDPNGVSATYEYIGSTDLIDGNMQLERSYDEEGNMVDCNFAWIDYMTGTAGKYITFQTCIDNSGRAIAQGHVFERR